MKKLAKISLVILLAVLLMSSVGALSACDTSWDGLHCELSDDGTYYIVTGVMEFGNIIKEYVIGDTYKGLPVKAIGEKAFASHWSAMKKITLPSTIESIGDYAFMDCDKLESIVIPEGVKYVGEWAFYDCDSLQQATLPNSLQFLGDEAFDRCPNLSYYQTENAKYLGNDQNNNLMLVGALSDQITKFDIPANTKFVGAHSFQDCKNLTELTLPDGLLAINCFAFGSCDSLQNVNIPNSVTFVGSYAFTECTSLRDIAIPNSVTQMGAGVFKDCQNLQNVEISNNLVYVSIWVFEGCPQINYNIYDNALYLGNDQNQYAMLVKAKTDITACQIHPNTKVILDSAFSSRDIQTITIPSGVVFIGENAFHYCDLLKSVVFQENSKVTQLSFGTFSMCKKLESITLQSGLQQIGLNVFGTCQSLQTINFNGTKEQWENIQKADWSDQFNGTATIVCTDGEISN